MSEIEIRAVDPVEADDDIAVRHAFDALERIERGEAKLVEFDPRAFREPKDRSDVIGSFLHESICRAGGCDASGGHSSLSYDPDFDDGVHYAWVAAWPALAAELREIAGAVPADLSYHQVTGPDGSPAQRFGSDEVAAAIAAVMHRHCDDPALMPAGCGEPARAVCREAARAGSVVAWWMDDYKIALVPAACELVMQPGLIERSRARHELFWRMLDDGDRAGLDHSESLDRALAAAYGDESTS